MKNIKKMKKIYNLKLKRKIIKKSKLRHKLKKKEIAMKNN